MIKSSKLCKLYKISHTEQTEQTEQNEQIEHIGQTEQTELKDVDFEGQLGMKWINSLLMMWLLLDLRFNSIAVLREE